jgi:hypothetical protein
VAGSPRIYCKLLIKLASDISFQNGHEICFVGGEAFMELSKIDPNADESLRKAIEKDNLVK